MISFSVAFDPNRGIGIRGSLPWHLKDELKIFKQNTLYKNILMGQTTFDTLPRKLTDRYITVVSIDPDYTAEDAEVTHDLIAFLKEHENDETEYIVCGGASIYRQAYPYAKKAYISFVKQAYEVDAYFDVYDENDWIVSKEVDYPDFVYRELKRKGADMTRKDGNIYVPFEDRKGNESIVYFTRDISPAGIKKAYEKVNANICGKVAIKLHTGEKNGPNIIPAKWVKEVMESCESLKDATIIETNTYYEGDRYTTEQHRETLEVNGWTFCPVDITDEEGTVDLPVEGGNWFDHMTVGSHMVNYDSLFTLTHFKGHTQGGFGGSNKNIGIGCADGRIGKAMIHSSEKGQWATREEELMEKISESTKATIDFFGKHVTYVNVMRNMSVSCDCEGLAAAPVVTPNVGILASTDICAIDSACVDLVHAMTQEQHHDLWERMQSRHGFRQLSYMKELGMGNDRYILIDLDNDEVRISAKEAVKDVIPFKRVEF
ncbi:MAG: dihydrofolate reductase [Erysipelotrichaceae bacterium]|nr:dihydrofolate reductase [Erysipelotrichaceae bacterium]